MSRGSLRRVRRRAGQRQDRLALLLALGPYEIGLVVDVLENHREGAIVLARHRSALALEFHAESEHGATLRQIDLERRLPQRFGIDAAMLLDGARQHFRHEHVRVAGRHAHVRRAHLGAGPSLLVLLPNHLDHGRQRGAQRLLVGEPDRDRVDIEEVIDVAAERLFQLVVDAVAGAVADQRAEAKPLLAGLTEEQRDVRVVAGVEDDIRAAALELGHQRRQIRGRRRISFLQHDVEAGLLGAFLVAPRDVDAARLDEVVYHELGTERVELGAAARERAGVVIDDADLQLLALRRRVRRQRETQHHRQRDQPTRDAHRSVPKHASLPSERGSAAAGIRSWSSNNVKGRAGRRVVIPFGIMSAPPSARDVPGGGYRFLPGIAPFSSGAVASSGYQVVHATLRAPLPWRDGFALIDRHLHAEGRPRAALCAIELRSRAPFSFEGFDAFNAGYRALLTDWKLLVDGENPIARTNVAPVVGAPTEPSLYGFGYTIPGGTPRPTFIVAGAGEMRERGVGVEGIVRHGETSTAAMREKAAHVMAIMQARLHGLGVAWSDVTAIDIYTAKPIAPFLADTVLVPAGPSAIHGVRWFPSRPPIVGLEYEMDLRGVSRELLV